MVLIMRPGWPRSRVRLLQGILLVSRKLCCLLGAEYLACITFIMRPGWPRSRVRLLQGILLVSRKPCCVLGAQASCLYHFHHAARMAALPGSSSPGYSIGFPKAVLCFGSGVSCLHHFHHAARMAALPGSSSPGDSIGFPKTVLCSGSAGILPVSLPSCGQDGRAPGFVFSGGFYWFPESCVVFWERRHLACIAHTLRPGWPRSQHSQRSRVTFSKYLF